MNQVLILYTIELSLFTVVTLFDWKGVLNHKRNKLIDQKLLNEIKYKYENIVLINNIRKRMNVKFCFINSTEFQVINNEMNNFYLKILQHILFGTFLYQISMVIIFMLFWNKFYDVSWIKIMNPLKISSN